MAYIKYPASGSGSGLTTYANFAALPASANDGDAAVTLDTDTIYIYNLATTTWLPVAAPGAALSIGTIDTGTPSDNGAQILSTALIMQSASATKPGLVNLTTQSFAGNKTFTGTIAASNLSGTNTGDVSLGTASGLSLVGQALSLGLASAGVTGALSGTDWSTFNGKQAAGNYITALTGDVTASGPGSVAATVAKIQGTTVSGTTGSGNVAFSSAPTLLNPVVGTQSQGDSSTKAASTAYVDTAVANAVAGVNPAVAVQAATTSAANTASYTYNNGVSGVGATLTGPVNTALTVDGYTFTAVGQRLLVKDDTQSPSGAYNGVYYVTQVQTAILPLILTRALDYNTPSDMNNTGAIPVINGTVNGTTSWVMTALVVAVGTTPLTFVKFTRNPADYLLVANNLSDVSSASTSFNNLSGLTTLGDLIYGGASGTRSRLAGNTTTAKQYLSQTGNGSVSAAPVWATVAFADLSGSVSAAQMPALTGDVTTSAGAVATTIAANAVTNAKAAQMPANTLKGNNTGSTANAADLTVTQVAALLSIAGNLTADVFSGNGSTTAFTLSVTPAALNNTAVFISGVYQQKSTYTLSGTTLTFGTAPPTGTSNIEVVSGTTLSIGTPGAGTVTSAAYATSGVGPNAIENAGLAASVASSILTLALKQNDGSTDATASLPVIIGFRSATLTSGAYVMRTVTAALSIAVASGATLGVANGTTYPIYVYAIDNAGTVELAVSSSLFDEGKLVSTTVMNSSATDDGVMYSTTARTNVACRLLFRCISTQTTAGTWAAVPTTISPVPFQAPLVIRAGDIATTRVTAAPAKLGEYRSQLRNAGAQTWTDTNGTPTATSFSADGFRAYSGNAFASADTNNQPTRYYIYVGKNKNVNWQWYASSGRTGMATNAILSTANTTGYTQSYDPTTGIVSIAPVYLSGSEAAHHSTLDQNGVVQENSYFDVIVTENRTGQ